MALDIPDIIDNVSGFLALADLSRLKRVNRCCNSTIKRLVILADERQEDFLLYTSPRAATVLSKRYLRLGMIERFKMICGNAGRFSLNYYEVFSKLTQKDFWEVYEKTRKYHWIMECDDEDCDLSILKAVYGFNMQIFRLIVGRCSAKGLIDMLDIKQEEEYIPYNRLLTNYL
jgi:hypothetical protein